MCRLMSIGLLVRTHDKPGQGDNFSHMNEGIDECGGSICF